MADSGRFVLERSGRLPLARAQSAPTSPDGKLDSAAIGDEYQTKIGQHERTKETRMIIKHPKPGTYLVHGRSWKLSQVRFSTPTVYNLDTKLDGKTKVRYEVTTYKFGRLYVDDVLVGTVDLSRGGLAAVADLRVRALMRDALEALALSSPTQEMIVTKLKAEREEAAAAQAKRVKDAINKL
jgi:hypothetical protein